MLCNIVSSFNKYHEKPSFLIKELSYLLERASVLEKAPPSN